MSGLDKVYGVELYSCAWCSREAVTSYNGVMTNGEQVSYQVCVRHYDEFVDSKK